MRQGVLPFQYAEEKSGKGLTGLAGLGLYLDLMHAAKLPASMERHVYARKGGQGYADRQVLTALMLLQLAGGDAVDDLRVLEKDEGFCLVLRKVEYWGLLRKARRGLERRWRKERSRTVPSPSAAMRYLAGFHEASEEEKRQPHTAFIPAPNTALRGLGRVNRDLIAFVQKGDPKKTATLDMDATLVETEKDEALYSYKHYKAYQPLTTYWAEQGVVVHSEFRDGNVPAGYEQCRVLEESTEQLPPGVEVVYHRSDTAGYQQEVLEYCAEGKNKRFGVIGFAIGVDVTPEFRQAVRGVEEKEWHRLERKIEREVEGVEKQEKVPTDQEWAEVCFVPQWIGRKKSSADYRYVAVREPVRQPPLEGMEEQLPFPTVTWSTQRYKVTGIVTNRDLPGPELIAWYRERCGKSEEAHKIMKEDLAGGKPPSGEFGKNAAWWGITALAFNLHRAMKRFLEPAWQDKRLKAERFALISLPGRVVQRGRQFMVRLSQGHPSFPLLVQARKGILAWAAMTGT